MTAPQRIQRRRTKGWRMPPGTVSVTRPGRWGNPFSVDDRGAAVAVALFADHLDEHPELVAAARAELSGRDLACWCGPTWCHGEVLLMAANDPVGSRAIHWRSEWWAGLGDVLGCGNHHELARSARRRAAEWERQTFEAIPLGRPRTRGIIGRSAYWLMVKAGQVERAEDWCAALTADPTIPEFALREMES